MPLRTRAWRERETCAKAQPPTLCVNVRPAPQVAKLLFTHAKDDMGQNFFKVRDILTAVQCLRMNKIVQGIQQIQGPVTITLRNLSAFECNQVRHIFLHGMDNFHELAELVSGDAASQGAMAAGAAPL